MKKILTTLLLVAGLAGTAISQKIPDRPEGPPPTPHKPRHEKKGGAQHLPLKELELSDAQRDAFRKQRESFKQRMDVLKKEENITVKEWKSRMENLRKENLSVMQNILTSEQKTKMSELRRKTQDRQMQGIKKQLNLTEDQLSQLKKQRAATQKQLQAIRENNTLTETDKKEATRKLMKEQKESFGKLLTPEQKAKQKEMRPPHGPKGRPGRQGMMPPPPDAPAPISIS